jgi:hypothetical protein
MRRYLNEGRNRCHEAAYLYDPWHERGVPQRGTAGTPGAAQSADSEGYADFMAELNCRLMAHTLSGLSFAARFTT